MIATLSRTIVLRLREVVVAVSRDGIMQGFTDEDMDYDTEGNAIDSDDLSDNSTHAARVTWPPGCFFFRSLYILPPIKAVPKCSDCTAPKSF